LLEYYGLVYGIHPRVMLALLEAGSGLISNPRPTAEQLARPLSPAGPAGFVAQIEWGYRELLAGMQPSAAPPQVTFSDGTQRELSLNQSAEGVAVQQLLSLGRTQRDWSAAVTRFNEAFARYFDNRLPAMSSPQVNGRSTLRLAAPWPIGTRVQHLAYFDHEYPLVDSGGDGNSRMVDYLGRSNVQYNSHDGHDFTFPDAPFATPILAAAGGTAYARVDPIGRGLGVVILHPDGFETVYWHLGAFDAIFDGKIDTNTAVSVSAGTRLGTSGASGVGVNGTPHLHFEVRRREGGVLKQIDPFGWYGSTPDPCAAHPRCQTIGWLWNAGITGIPPFLQPRDTTPPIGTLHPQPAADVLLQVGFDGHPLQTIGSGTPPDGDFSYIAGRHGQAIRLDSGELRYAIDGTAVARAGTLAIWVQVPAGGAPAETQVVVSSSRQPWDAPYAQTLRLQRDREAGRPQWAFITVGPNGETQRLAVDDTLSAGWHLLTISWRQSDGVKRLSINGAAPATTGGAILPTQLADELWLGRRTAGAPAAALAADELTVLRGLVNAVRFAALYNGPPAVSLTPTLTTTDVLIDANAYDRGGGVTAVQIAVNGSFSPRMPFAESYRIGIPAREGPHTITARYIDAGENAVEVSRTVNFDAAPTGYFGYRADGGRTRVLVTAYDQHLPLQLQISEAADFADAAWQPFQSSFLLNRPPPSQLYLRLRDANGNISAVMYVTADAQRVLLPLPLP
jgi:murein DD-endopeptidase MepM/ murein hydrolase activator NlpD